VAFGIVPLRNGMSIPASGMSLAMQAKPPSMCTKSFCISTMMSTDFAISGGRIVAAISLPNVVGV
jgi:hypothetical protein